MFTNTKRVKLYSASVLLTLAAVVFTTGADTHATACSTASAGPCDVEVTVNVSEFLDFRTAYYNGLTDQQKAAYDAMTDAEQIAADPDRHPSTTVTNGGTKEDATSDFLVSTNYLKGYNLTVQDADANNALTSATSSIPAGTTFSGNTSAWAIKTTKSPISGWTIRSGYFAVPVSTATAVTIVQSPAITTTAIVDDQIPITYGVYANPAQAAGTYTDTIVYTAAVNP